MLSRSCARFLPSASRNRGAIHEALLRPHAAPSAAVAGHNVPPQQRPSPRFYPNERQRQQCRTWSNNAAAAAPKPKARRRPKKGPGPGGGGLSEGASSGRIAWYDERAKKASGLPKLCSGCGVEMVSESQRRPRSDNDKDEDDDDESSNRRMTAGRDATSGRPELSKRAQKKARYADVLENSRNDKESLCGRCVALQSKNVWKAYDALKDVDADVFSSQLEHIVSRRRFGLCVVVVDATDPEFTAVRRLRDWIKGTPCILAVNKADLLPRPMESFDLNYVRGRIQSNRARSTLGAYGVSAATGAGMVGLAEGILENLGGRDVFVVGSANVGKSTLVKSLSNLLARTLKMRGRNRRADDKRRSVLKNLNITRSHLPGTTLQAVRIPCFPSTRHAMWDTPGIINRSALAYSLFPSHLMEPLAFPERIEVPTEENGKKILAREGDSILIEAGWVGDAIGDGANDAMETVSNAEERMQKEDIDDADGDEEESRHDDDHNAINASDIPNGEEEPHKNSNNPFTLARLDITEDNGMSVEALAFVPSCLSVRVVPTSEAPSVSAVPERYVEKVRNLVGSSGNFDDPEALARPLAVFKGDGQGVNRDGSVEFTREKHGKQDVSSEWIRQDIVFASLGWINLNHRRNFTVRPWCVKESLWSKRRALYPSNLDHLESSEWAEQDNDALNFASMAEDDPALDRIRRRLEDAAERGRHLADHRGRRKKAETKQSYGRGDREFVEKVEKEEEDEWW